MTDKTPAGRPALRKAVDATLHPALAGRPTTIGRSTPALSGKPSRATSSTGKPLSKAKRAPTSDVLRPTKKDPAVSVKLAMPKSLRRKLRAQAKQVGVEPEELAVRLIADGLR